MTPHPAQRLRLLGDRVPLAVLVAGVTLYAISPVLVGASTVPGPVFAFWRLWQGVAVLGLAALVGIRAGGRRPDLAALRWPLWAGLCFGAHQLLFFSAVKLTTVTDVALVQVLSPLVVAALAVPMFGERPRPRFFGWAGVAMGGAALVALGASTGPQGDPAGMAMAAANILFYGLFFLVAKRARADIDVLPFLTVAILVAAVGVSAFVLAAGQPVTPIAPRDLWLAFAVAAGPGAVGHFLTTWPLDRLAANVPPVVTLGTPVVSGGLAWAFLGEPVTAMHALGGLVTFAGVLGALRSPAGRELLMPPVEPVAQGS